MANIPTRKFHTPPEIDVSFAYLYLQARKGAELLLTEFLDPYSNRIYETVEEELSQSVRDDAQFQRDLHTKEKRSLKRYIL